jgi:hypothetical protein
MMIIDYIIVDKISKEASKINLVPGTDKII